MSDDLSKTGMQDRTRINTSEDYELRYWVREVWRFAGPAESSGAEGRQLGFGGRERAQGRLVGPKRDRR